MVRTDDGFGFLARLGVRLPIIQAPMAGVSTPALAAAASNAGALGSLGVAAMSLEDARSTIRQTRSLTDKPFNVNVFCHAPAVADLLRHERWLAYLEPHFARFGAKAPTSLKEIYTSFVESDALLELLLDVRPAVVSFHFGLPDEKRIAALKSAGIVLIATATDLEEGRQIADAGIDAIVAQGIEAGGHRGSFDPTARDLGLGTFALVRLLAKKIALPVIAAGGIMDGQGIVAALALGAQAAQLGTAFVSCPESAADEPFRRALRNEKQALTTLTRAISGRPARGLANAFTLLGEDPDRPPEPDYPIAYDAGKALHAAAKARGNAEYAAQWAGQAVPLSRSMPAGQLVETLAREIDETLEGLRARVTVA